MHIARRLLTAGLVSLSALQGVATPAPASERNLVVATARAQPTAEPRNALVIGNSDYPNAPLANPVNDARAVAERLTQLRFRVALLENASQDQMYEAVRAFGDALGAGGVGVFYYAGHAIQVRGRNYLLPARAQIQREDEIIYRTVDTGQILAKMESARNRVNVVILDACRNNPFGREFRNIAPGLAVIDAPHNTLIAFATAPGAVASDGAGRNGLYTQHLLQSLGTPGLRLEDVFKKVRTGVRQDSAGRQVPWENTSLEVDFYFDPLPHQVAAAAAASPDPLTVELAFWDSIKGSADPEDYRAYLQRYPNGQFAALATNRLRALTAPPAAAPVTALPGPTQTGAAAAKPPAAPPPTLAPPASPAPSSTAAPTTPAAAALPAPVATLPPAAATSTGAAAAAAAPSLASTVVAAVPSAPARPPASAPPGATAPSPAAPQAATGAAPELMPLRTLAGHSGETLALAVSRSGAQALIGAADRTLRLWDLAAGRELRAFHGHTAAVTSVAIAQDGRQFLSGSADRSVRLWDAASGAELARMSAHAAPVTAVALGPTARHAVSVADDGEVVVWELPGGRLLQRARDEGQRLGGVALSPDGRYALTGADSGTLRLWDVGGLRVVRSFAPPADAVAAPVVSVGFSDDGRRVAGVDAGGTVWIWDLQTGALLNRIATASAAPARAAVGADAGTALVAGADGQLALWEIGSGRALWCSGLGERRATAVALGPRAASGALVASDDKRLLLWGPSP